MQHTATPSALLNQAAEKAAAERAAAEREPVSEVMEQMSELANDGGAPRGAADGAVWAASGARLGVH